MALRKKRIDAVRVLAHQLDFGLWHDDAHGSGIFVEHEADQFATAQEFAVQIVRHGDEEAARDRRADRQRPAAGAHFVELRLEIGDLLAQHLGLHPVGGFGRSEAQLDFS